MPTSVKSVTAVTRANTAALKCVTVHSFPCRPSIHYGSITAVQKYLAAGQERSPNSHINCSSTVSGHYCLSFQTDWQQDLIKQKLLRSSKGCKCEFKYAYIMAEQTVFLRGVQDKPVNILPTNLSLLHWSTAPKGNMSGSTNQRLIILSTGQYTVPSPIM